MATPPISYDPINWDTTKYVNPSNMNHIDEGILTVVREANSLRYSVDHLYAETIKASNVTPYSGAIPVNADLLGGRITADDVERINNNLSQLFHYEYGTIANGWSDYINYSNGRVIKFEIEVGTDIWRDGIGVNGDGFQRIFIEDNGVSARLFNNASTNVGYRFRILVSKL